MSRSHVEMSQKVKISHQPHFSGKTHKISEFNDLCGLLLGPWASHLATVFSVLAVLGAAIVYWVLLSNFLYSTVSFIYTSIEHKNETKQVCCY